MDTPKPQPTVARDEMIAALLVRAGLLRHLLQLGRDKPTITG